MEQKKMNNKGFSLVELIIVIAIMAILIGVLAPQFIKYVEKSRVSKDLQNMQELKTAIEVYAAGNEGLAAAVVVTPTTTSGTTTIAVTGGKSGGNVDATDLGGVATSITLSSKNWTATGASYTYSTTYVWTPAGTCTNASGEDLASVFN